MHKILQLSLFNRFGGKILLLVTLTFNFLYSIEPKIVIHWSSVKTPGHAELLKDRTGQPLDAGAPNNGDGNLVVLGYFTDANTTHPFSGIWTPLTFGTVWDNSFEWAFYMNPKPDVIYFMTDGNSNKSFQGIDLIKQKKGKTKIYTIGYGAPAGAKLPLEEIAAMTGGKSKFVDMDEIRMMEKEIDANGQVN